MASCGALAALRVRLRHWLGWWQTRSLWRVLGESKGVSKDFSGQNVLQLRQCFTDLLAVEGPSYWHEKMPNQSRRRGIIAVSTGCQLL